MRTYVPFQEGRFYHIYNRGNNGENIFIEERNYAYFLALYTKHISPIADTYAYCLMRNHFHLLIRVNDAKGSERSERSDPFPANHASRAFQSFFGAYAMAINKASGRHGRLFEEHFDRIAVDSDDYFTNLIFYIHFNPQKHRFVSDFRSWKWSSYHAIATSRPTQVQREHVLDWFGGTKRFVRFHQEAVDEKMIAHLIGNDD